MKIELKEPALVKRVEQLASETTSPAEQVLETAVRSYLDEVEREAISAETQAFWEMHEQLLRAYPGRHVALHQGQVVDHDEDPAVLEKRVREQLGMSPVLFAPVQPGPQRDLRWLGGRTEGRKPVK